MARNRRSTGSNKKEAPGAKETIEADGAIKPATNDDDAVERDHGEPDETNRVETPDDDESEHDASNNNNSSEEPKPSSAVSATTGTTNPTEPKLKTNALTHLVPGYTARMKLDSSSLDKHRCGIKELGRRAERKDASTRDFVREATADKANNSLKKTKEGFLPKSYTAAYSHFKHGTKRAPDDTAGKGWFGMKPSAMTDDLKTDLALIRNRTYLDPKRFYKTTDKHHRIVQMGTVIEGASEFYSSRLTKKERRANLTEELMNDQKTSNYAKNKFKKMAKEKAYQAELRKPKPKKRARKFY